MKTRFTFFVMVLCFCAFGNKVNAQDFFDFEAVNAEGKRSGGF